MPRLPDVQSLGQRRTPRATRGVQDVRAAGAGFTRGADIIAAEAARTGTGLVALGQNLTSAAKVLEAGRLKRQAAADKLATAQAKSRFLIADIAARNAFEGDQEFATYESRYLEIAKEACESAAEGLRPELKGLFAASCGTDIARGRVAVAKQARKMEVGVGRAQVDQIGADNLEAARQATDERTRADLLNSTREANEAAALQGFLTPEELGDRNREAAENHAIAQVELLPPAQRLEALQEGMTRTEGGQPIFQKTRTVIDFIPIDKRVEMIADAQNKVVAIRREERLAAERAEKSLLKAEALAREETADQFTIRLYDEDTDLLTYEDVLASNLKATQKRVFLSVLDKDDKAGQTNEAFYNEIFLKIGAGEIVSDQLAEVVLPFLGKGITGEDYTRLRSFAEKIHKERGGPALTDFLRMAKAQISKTNFFGDDPLGEQQYYKFLSDFNLALELRRAEGVPLADLLRPGDPNYLGPMINDYIRPLRQQLKDFSDRQRGFPLIPEPGGSPVFTPRLTGESDEDYIRRLGGQ